jgi:hypothetical protein
MPHSRSWRPGTRLNKHREAHQTAGSDWTLSALRKQRVLHDLHAAWVEVNRNSTLAFWTNGGFSGDARSLHKACISDTAPPDGVVSTVALEVDIDKDEAAAFMQALKMSPEPLPRRKEIADSGIRRTETLLRMHRPDGVSHAEACYKWLVDAIYAAGTDLPDGESRPTLGRFATMASEVRERSDWAAWL